MRAGSLLTGVLRRAETQTRAGTWRSAHSRSETFLRREPDAYLVQRRINPQAHLPYLATYLGHRDINSTLVYLTITEELLQQASERFRRRGAQVLLDSPERGKA